MLDKTFMRFFFGFVTLVGVAFGVLAIAGSQMEEVEPEINIANP